MKFFQSKYILPFLVLILSLSFQKNKQKEGQIIKIKPYSQFNLQVAEPSDMVYDYETNTIFVVSDNGYLAQIDTTGKLISKTKRIGTDFEAITLFNNQLVTIDETPRTFGVYDKNFKLIRNKSISYNGGRNKGFESITYVPHKNTFFTATEKDPVVLYEFDTLFNVIQEIRLPFKISDVSGLSFFDNYLWILSDEDRTVHKCKLETLIPEKSFLLPIINPEGITFNQNGDMYICSDDMEKLYVFKNTDLK